MATRNLVEDEGIFYYLREQYGSVDKAMAAHAEAGGLPGVSDEASLREALAGPQHDQIIAVLIGLAKAPPPAGHEGLGPDIHGNSVRSRTETVDNNETITIHAEKNQDIEVENDETHWVGHDRAKSGFWGDDNGNIPFGHGAADGPSTLLGLQSEMQHENRFSPSSAAVWDDTDIAHVTGDKQMAEEPFQFHKLTGDWNSDGRDTLGFGDANGDADVDGADFAL